MSAKLGSLCWAGEENGGGQGKLLHITEGLCGPQSPGFLGLPSVWSPAWLQVPVSVAACVRGILRLCLAGRTARLLPVPRALLTVLWHQAALDHPAWP